MKRANRLIQIEAHKRDVKGRLGALIKSGRRPLAYIMKNPAVTMMASALVVGMLTRVVTKAPLPAPLKILTIPLVRRLASGAFVAYKKISR